MTKQLYKYIIDGDIIAYQAACAADRDLAAFGDVPDSHIESCFLSVVESWTKNIMRWKPNEMMFCRSDDKSQYFRHQIDPSYKSNHDPEKKPTRLKYAKELLEGVGELIRSHKLDNGDDHWLHGIPTSFYTVGGLEADDILGMVGTNPNINNTIVISIDKDMFTLPTIVYNPKKSAKPVSVNQRMADYRVFFQAICGDQTDGYAGIKGVGKVGAEKALQDAKGIDEMWDIYLKLGKEKHDEDYLISQVQLARILRYGDYNKNDRTVSCITPHPQPSRVIKLVG